MPTIKQSSSIVYSFKPKAVTKKLLGSLNDRARDVLINRFGLGLETEHKTLESIGRTYQITRERVRQIENSALVTIRKSQAFKEEESVFEELKKIVEAFGALVDEEAFLKTIAPKDKATQNHFLFYLALADQFHMFKENEHFNTCWSIDKDLCEKVHGALKTIYARMTDDDLIHHGNMVDNFLAELADISEHYKSEEIASRWLSISKKLAKSPLDEWGKATSPLIRTRGIKDFAYLVMRRHGNPMHFREVARAICDTFGRKTHIATCHNELIKDSRFVLVGRGFYALKEWGYRAGVVREVIRTILERTGPMTKDEIVDAVLKERFLKVNTILVNLQNPAYFTKDDQGKYHIKESIDNAE